MKRLVFAFVALVAVAAAVSCSKSKAPETTIGGDIVATANGHEISRAVLEAYTKNRSQHSFKELGATEQARMLDDLIEMVLIADAPRAEDAAAKAALEAQIELTRLNLNAQQKVNEVLKNPPSDAQLKAEYEAQAKLMVGVNEYLTRHIVVETEEQALAIIKQLKAGANFEKIAAANTTDPSAKAGVVAWIGPSEKEKVFADAVRNLKKGEFTPAPVQSQFGWHVIRLEDTRLATPPAFEAARAEILNTLQHKQMDAFIEGLKKQAKTEKKI
jgi:peptidyl-prolyl cis-trans isomerase C